MGARGGGEGVWFDISFTKVAKQKGPPTDSSFLPKAAYTAGTKKNLRRNSY